MGTAIRKHLRDFLAIIALAAIAAVTGWIILQNERLRVPVIERKPFELKAEFQTAQAVMPGQGQTVRVAGVRIGDIAKIDLNEGRAIIHMDIERRYLPVYRNATILLRPKTGLKDMFLELDPGDPSAGEFRNGDTVPSANTSPDINADEVLAALDRDSRDYLKLLVTGAGKGLKGRARDLGELFGRLGPINRYTARLNSAVAERRRELARLIHNFGTLTEELGRKDDELAQLVDSSNVVFGAFAQEDPHVGRAVALLPGALRTTREALVKVDRFARILGPATESLRPFARRLDDLNDSVRPFAKAAAPIIRDELRPFVKAARGPIRDLRPAAKALAAATPRQEIAFEKLGRFFNMGAYNPKGAEPPGAQGRDEGYLYWLAWLNHVAGSIFNSADANSVLRRIYLSVNCITAREAVANTPASAVTANFSAILTNPTLCPP